MNTDTSAEEPPTSDADGSEGHERHDRSIRDCCSGLRDGYADAWTEAELQD